MGTERVETYIGGNFRGWTTEASNLTKDEAAQMLVNREVKGFGLQTGARRIAK